MVQLTGAGWGISLIESGDIQKSRTEDPLAILAGAMPLLFRTKGVAQQEK